MTDISFLEYVSEQLNDGSQLSVRSMFGVVHNGSLYFRNDEASRAYYVRAGSRPFNPKGKQELHRDYEAPAEILENSQSFAV